MVEEDQQNSQAEFLLLEKSKDFVNSMSKERFFFFLLFLFLFVADDGASYLPALLSTKTKHSRMNIIRGYLTKEREIERKEKRGCLVMENTRPLRVLFA